MIHQAKLIVGVEIPRPLDLERAGGLTSIGVAQVERNAAVLAAKLLHRIEGRIAAGDA